VKTGAVWKSPTV